MIYEIKIHPAESLELPHRMGKTLSPGKYYYQKQKRKSGKPKRRKKKRRAI
jgi:hypothetical protein